jgi:hypothetical protein
VEQNIDGLILVDSEFSGASYGSFIIIREDVSDVMFCYSKEDLREALQIYAENLTSRQQDEYKKLVDRSNLPEYSLKDTISIDGSAGNILAKSLHAHRIAQSSRFMPNAGWPMINDVPTSGITVLCSSKERSELTSDHELQLCNILFAVSVGTRNIVYVANSQEQCAAVLEEVSTLPLTGNKTMSQIVGRPLLPEYSGVPLLRVIGEIANEICPAVFYYNVITERVKWLGFNQQKAIGWS